MNSSLRFVVLLALLLAGGIVVNAWEYLGEAKVTRKELKDFPSQIAAWKQSGSDQILDKETLSVLRASDYLSRDYRAADGQLANFYVGYYATQRDGASYHSPLNCLPGAGWVMNNPGKITITPDDGKPSFEANRYLIENSGNKSILIYWYQGRGRRVASEYWGKIFTVIDSAKLRRSDGAMVRVVVPVRNSEADALAGAARLAATTATVLPEFIPD
jgi:EpsI family protein